MIRSARAQVLTWLFAALMVAALSAMVWFLGLDVTADEPVRYGPQVCADPAPCGSSYSVLLRGNGYGGGEYPSNQAALDAQCLQHAGANAKIAGACALGAVAAAAAGVASARRAGVASARRAAGAGPAR